LNTSFKQITIACGMLIVVFFSYTIKTPPKAYADKAITLMNNEVIFEVLANDYLDGDVLEMKFVSMPEMGVVEINKDFSVKYIPEADICDEVDKFTYFIRTASGIDTTDISVEIICEELTFLSGFSPNDDGVFDNFTIIGVERYPNNQLIIFNAEGEQVYFRESYSNDWDGKIDGELPDKDSMFYFVFSDGNGNMHSGYVQVIIE
jgi:gliding motility-associated-like protein